MQISLNNLLLFLRKYQKVTTPKKKKNGGYKFNILDLLTQCDIFSHIYSKSDVMSQHFYNYFMINLK